MIPALLPLPRRQLLFAACSVGAQRKRQTARQMRNELNSMRLRNAHHLLSHLLPLPPGHTALPSRSIAVDCLCFTSNGPLGEQDGDSDFGSLDFCHPFPSPFRRPYAFLRLIERELFVDITIPSSLVLT